MKKLLTVLVLAAVCTSAFAQKVSYKEIKNVYSYKDYVKSDVDPYSVGWISFESFLVPGMGQLIMRETGRGWAFLGASSILSCINDSLIDSVKELWPKDADGNYAKEPGANKDKIVGYLWGIAGVSLAELGVCIWSSVDASRIAKVKNQYYQGGKYATSATLYPSVNYIQGETGIIPVSGMTFALKF